MESPAKLYPTTSDAWNRLAVSFISFEHHAYPGVDVFRDILDSVKIAFNLLHCMHFPLFLTTFT